MNIKEVFRSYIWEIPLYFLIGFFGSILLFGCAVGLQTAKTTASIPLPDGRVLHYESGKDQQGIDALYTQQIDPVTDKVIKKTLRLKVDKAGTPEAAYAAMVEQQRALAEQQKAVTELLKAVIKRLPVPVP